MSGSGGQRTRTLLQHVRDSPIVNVWCALMHNKIIGPFFFNESPTTATVYLDMLEGYVTPQLQEFQPWILFQQDGAPPHWGLIVRTFLDEIFPDRWIGRDSPTQWPPRSPDITPLDYFLWGHVKGQVFSLPVPDVHTLKVRIRHAVETVTEEMLQTHRERLNIVLTFYVQQMECILKCIHRNFMRWTTISKSCTCVFSIDVEISLIIYRDRLYIHPVFFNTVIFYMKLF